jgi:hypothetical protein
LCSIQIFSAPCQQCVERKSGVPCQREHVRLAGAEG